MNIVPNLDKGACQLGSICKKTNKGLLLYSYNKAGKAIRHKTSNLLNSLCEYLIQFCLGKKQITITSNIAGIPHSGHILANFMVIYTYIVFLQWGDSSHSINDLQCSRLRRNNIKIRNEIRWYAKWTSSLRPWDTRSKAVDFQQI